MNRSKQSFAGSGQGLVEFMLILPILLFIVMGIFDFGRVMIAYSSASNALREAARLAEVYGGEGRSTPEMDYLDCGAMREIAQRATFANVNVTVNYITYPRDSEGKPDPSAAPIIRPCVDNEDYGDVSESQVRTNDIVEITTVGNVSLITPLLSSAIPELPFEFTARRTVIKQLSLTGEAPTGDGTGDGTGNGSGDGTGNGSGDGSGDGTGDGTGNGTGNGSSDGSGTPPSGACSAARVQVEFLNWGSNQLPIRFTIQNLGSTPLTISTLKLRYYFTTDNAGITATYNRNSGANVSVTVGSLSDMKYFDIQFTDGGTIAVGGSLDTVAQIHENWQNGITYTNDYSGQGGSGQSTRIPLTSGSTLLCGTPASSDGSFVVTPVVSIAASSTTVNEGSSTTLTFSISATSNQAVTVNYTVSGTASSSDYSGFATVIFPSNSTTPQTLTIPITNDTEAEVSETIIVTLNSASGGATINSSANSVTITIPANDLSTVSVAASPTSAQEGASSSFVVTVSPASPLPVTVTYVIDGTATLLSDYTLSGASSPLSFAANETSKTITVPIVDDQTSEGDETIRLTLSNPSNATLGTTTATITIPANDPAVSVSLLPANATATEGQTATFTVSLPAPSTSAVSVNYALTGSAVLNSDYTVNPALVANGTILFAVNEQSKSYVFSITDDPTPEQAETIIFTLSNPSGVVLGTASQTLTIPANDMPLVTIDDFSVAENVTGGIANIPVRISPAVNQAVTIQYSTANNTATAGSDYTAVTGGTVTIPANASTANIPITINNDTVDEEDETFYVNLGTVTTNNASVTDAQSVVTILRDNADLPVVSIANISVQENAGTARFTIKLSAPAVRTVTVFYSTADGATSPAVAGSDYTAVSGSVTFAAGNTTDKYVDVPITYDSASESSENFVLNATVQNATPGSLQPTATIVNVAPLASTLSVQVREVTTNNPTNEIKPYTMIFNSGASSIPLSELEVRYYFTRDTAQTLNVDCFWAQVGCANIQRDFVAVSPSTTNADYYLRIRFTSGTLGANNNTGEMQFRIYKGDWSNFNRSNDHSYNPSASSYLNANNVTIYRNGELVWGTPPS